MKIGVMGKRTFAEKVHGVAREFGEVHWVDLEWDWSRFDVVLSVHNFEMIPRDHLRAPRYGVLGYHPSLLPRWRGNDAVRWTIEAGDPIAGGTVYQLDEGVDTGPICRQDWCFVKPGWDASDLWREELFPMGLRLIREELYMLDTLAVTASLVAVRRAQDESVAKSGPVRA